MAIGNLIDNNILKIIGVIVYLFILFLIGTQIPTYNESEENIEENIEEN